MKTSYLGCNKEIAESLKRGQHIKCICGGSVPAKVIAYVEGSSYPYRTTGSCCSYSIAEPIKTETYVIDAVSMMKGLVKRGYKVTDDGNWKKNNHVDFITEKWRFCGFLLPSGYAFEDWMLEEREVGA